MQEWRDLKYKYSFFICMLQTNYLELHPFINLFLFFSSCLISSLLWVLFLDVPSVVATHVHYTCVMHQEAKRKRENRISSASPPILPFNRRYHPHTFSFGLSAQKKRRKRGKEEEKEEKSRCERGTKLRSQSMRRRIDRNHSLNKNVFLSRLITMTLRGYKLDILKLNILSFLAIWFIIMLRNPYLSLNIMIKL